MTFVVIVKTFGFSGGLCAEAVDSEVMESAAAAMAATVGRRIFRMAAASGSAAAAPSSGSPIPHPYFERADHTMRRCYRQGRIAVRQFKAVGLKSANGPVSAN